jgi:hypothetical protein
MTTPTTEPTGLVQVQQSDLDGFATSVSAASAAITAATTTIAASIQTLLANQATPLPAADEANLTTAVSGLQAAATALAAIEVPAPAST